MGELTPRQRELLTLAATGMSNAEIAARLDTSYDNVRLHFVRIYDRLGVTDWGQPRVRAVLVALGQGA